MLNRMDLPFAGCICGFIKLHITAQPGPDIPLFRCYTYVWIPSNCVWFYLIMCFHPFLMARSGQKKREKGEALSWKGWCRTHHTPMEKMDLTPTFRFCDTRAVNNSIAIKYLTKPYAALLGVGAPSVTLWVWVLWKSTPLAVYLYVNTPKLRQRLVRRQSDVSRCRCIKFNV